MSTNLAWARPCLVSQLTSVHFNCCSLIASTSAAPWLSHLLQLLLSDCICFLIASASASCMRLPDCISLWSYTSTIQSIVSMKVTLTSLVPPHKHLSSVTHTHTHTHKRRNLNIMQQLSRTVSFSSSSSLSSSISAKGSSSSASGQKFGSLLCDFLMCICSHYTRLEAATPPALRQWHRLEGPPQFNGKLGRAWVMAFILSKAMSAAFELIVAAPKWTAKYTNAMASFRVNTVVRVHAA